MCRGRKCLVEAAIVELSADTALNLGVEWRGAWEEEGVLISGNTLGEMPVPDAPDFGGGFTYGYFYDDDFWFVVRALAGATDSNLLPTAHRRAVGRRCTNRFIHGLASINMITIIIICINIPTQII